MTKKGKEKYNKHISSDYFPWGVPGSSRTTSVGWIYILIQTRLEFILIQHLPAIYTVLKMFTKKNTSGQKNHSEVFGRKVERQD